MGPGLPGNRMNSSNAQRGAAQHMCAHAASGMNTPADRPITRLVLRLTCAAGRWSPVQLRC